jgi:hypothetical protein
MEASTSWPLRLLTLREQIDPDEVLDVLGIVVHGSGQLSCPNPDHRDTHPSARLYEGGKVHCFTCAKTWDMVGLVQLVHRLSFPDAVAWLEQQFGVEAFADASMIRSVLRRHGRIDCSGLTAMVETAIAAARPRCTIAGYARLWRAYDVACHSFATRKIDEATLVAALDRVLALTPPPEAPAQP